jgi:riboflavin kinase/FMN adenylyltransferase
MKVVHGIDALEPSLGRLFIVIGVFDGLHLGHEYLLDQLGTAAHERAASPAVITFDHHPDEVITGAAPPLLCDPGERLDRLAAAGVEVTVVQTFDVALRMTPFDAFVRRIAERIELAGFLMTPESAFGHDRGGTPATVAALGNEIGFDVAVVPPLLVGGTPVSSGTIRRAIAEGRLADAERRLGRRYAAVGERAADAGPRVRIRFPMPVALPPPARYAVRVSAGAGAGPAESGWAVVGPDGALEVEAAGLDPAIGDRVRVVFAGARAGDPSGATEVP